MPDMLPTECARMISEFSQEDLSKVRVAAREDHVAIRSCCDQTSQSEDDESENEEVEESKRTTVRKVRDKRRNTTTILW